MANMFRTHPRAAVLAALAVIAAGTGVAYATPSGPNGRIAFRRYADANQTSGAVFTMNADGSDVRQVTRPAARTVDDQPDWSPDGKSLTFSSCGATCYVWVVNADGSGRRRVTHCAHAETPTGVPKDCEDGQFASFAPDGQHVTFTRSTGHVKRFKKFDYNQIEHSAIAIARADGNGDREIYRLPRYSGDAMWPQLSPNGKLIVFERATSPAGKPRFGHGLFVLNADGTGVHRVTPWSLHAGDGPDWAPDSSRILFRSNEDTDKQSQYYTVRPDGSGLTQLTHFPQGTKLFSASFSPDGTKIVFARGDAKGRGDVWTMNADGTGAQSLLQASPWDSAADWGSGS
jgi:Tol biopolymer transport system component